MSSKPGFIFSPASLKHFFDNLGRLPLLQTVLNPYVFAILVSGLVYWLLPRGALPLEMEVVHRRNLADNRLIYSDLNNDGVTERVVLKTSRTNPYIEILDLKDRHIAVWNLRGSWSDYRFLIHGDYDGNGYEELYTVIDHRDSVFLCANEILIDGGLFIERYFLFKKPKHNGNPDYTIAEGGMSDVNRDGYPEAVFAFAAGYSLQPRGVYAFDVRNRSLISSPAMAAFPREMTFADLDHDGFEEIWIATLASGNYHPNDSTPFSDQATWLMVLGENLQLEFDPIPFYGQTNKLIYTVFLEEEGQMLALLRATNADYEGDNVFVFDAEGEIRYSQNLADWDRHIFLLIAKAKEGNRYYLGSIQKQEVFELTRDFKLLRREVPAGFAEPIAAIDIDSDGAQELIFQEEKGKLYVLDPNFSILGELQLEPVIERLVGSVAMVHGVSGEEYIAFVVNKNEWLVSVTPNRWYPWRFFRLIFIYFGIAGIIWVSLKLQSLRAKRQARITSEIQQWQLKYTLAQLSPHFTFNALNAIGSVIKQEDPDKAYDYMVRFTKLIRSSLENAEKIAWSLEEELRFVDHYLKLQQLRFRNLFEFEITIDQSVSQHIQVPKMLIQHCAENAVKHGLRSVKEGGLLDISIIGLDSGIQIAINDNGIGRKAAGMNRVADSVGRGDQLSRQLVSLYSKLTGREINLQINDLYDERGCPGGTEVIINIGMD